MKIKIEFCSGETYSAQEDIDHITDLAKMFKGLLVQVGYHPESVDKLFSEELESWFPEDDNQTNKYGIE